MLERFGDETMKLDTPTVLHLAKIAVEKYALSSTQPGFILSVNGQKIKVRFSELSAALEDLSQKDLVVVHRCEDCDNWNKSPKGSSGSCFPKDFTCGRSPGDFCSKNYIPRSSERRKTDEAITALLSKKRAGNGS